MPIENETGGGRIKSLISAVLEWRHTVIVAAILLLGVLIVAFWLERAGVFSDLSYSHHVFIEVILIVGLFIFGWLAVLYQYRISRSLKEKVSEQQEFMASILQNSIDAIIFIDLNNHVEVWNRGAELMFGYTADEMLGQSFHRLVPSDIDADAELQEIREKAEKHGFVKNYRTARMTKDGQRIQVDISRTLVRSETGDILGSTAIIKDITETVDVQQKIYNAEKLASIGTLAAGVAHEINNPLSIILGFVDLLAEKFDEGSSEFNDLKIIEQNAQNAKQIVDNMLGFARVTEGFEDTVDVPNAIEMVVKIVKSALLGEKIDVAVEIPDNLPRVKGDPREIQQVLLNLINNATAAMATDGGTLTVSASQHGDKVEMSVADTGEGIPERYKMKIFDPFFTTKKVGEGTGLGLSLCYGIVSKYGGTITFESHADEDEGDRPGGSTFVVSLPVADLNEPD